MKQLTCAASILLLLFMTINAEAADIESKAYVGASNGIFIVIHGEHNFYIKNETNFPFEFNGISTKIYYKVGGKYFAGLYMEIRHEITINPENMFNCIDLMQDSNYQALYKEGKIEGYIFEFNYGKEKIVLGPAEWSPNLLH